MKKQYLTPEAEWLRVSFEENILSNGQDLNMRDYGSDDSFWS